MPVQLYMNLVHARMRCYVTTGSPDAALLSRRCTGQVCTYALTDWAHFVGLVREEQRTSKREEV